MKLIFPLYLLMFLLNQSFWYQIKLQHFFPLIKIYLNLQIKDVEMSKTKLSIYQGIYLFSKLSEKPVTKKLKIDNNDFSLVPVDYISKGVNKLKEIDLVATRLTDIQMTAIFIEMLENSEIEKIALDGNVESTYKDFVKSLKDKVNVIVTFDRSHEITTIHLFKKF